MSDEAKSRNLPISPISVVTSRRTSSQQINPESPKSYASQIRRTSQHIVINPEEMGNESPLMRISTNFALPESSAFLSGILEAIAEHFMGFYALHLTYFLCVPMIGAIIFYFIEQDSIGVTFVDSMFTVFSAMTCAGLVVVDFGKISLASEILLVVIMTMGSSVLLSIVPLAIRTELFKNDIREYNLACASSTDEYRIRHVNRLKYFAMRRLIWVLLAYFFIFQLIPTAIVWMYVSLNANAKQILVDNGEPNPFMFSLFHVVSSFNNAGLGTLSANLIPFRTDFFLLFIFAVLILLGNTLFPVALRYIIKGLKHFSKSEENQAIYAFLLLNSRECFTNLFPDVNTNILLLYSIVVNCFQWFMFMALDWKSGFFGDMTSTEKVFSALFQSISTRLAGFQIFDLSNFSFASF